MSKKLREALQLGMFASACAAMIAYPVGPAGAHDYHATGFTMSTVVKSNTVVPMGSVNRVTTNIDVTSTSANDVLDLHAVTVVFCVGPTATAGCPDPASRLGWDDALQEWSGLGVSIQPVNEAFFLLIDPSVTQLGVFPGFGYSAGDSLPAMLIGDISPAQTINADLVFDLDPSITQWGFSWAYVGKPVVCGDGHVVGTEVCDDGNALDGDCCSSTCDTLASGGTVCRPAAGACDVEETCDGISALCPADGFETAGTECRSAGGACDVPETCTGAGAACPADGKSTAECRPDAGDCDVPETCNGIDDQCPTDAFEPDGTTCDDMDANTIDDMCASGLCLGADAGVCGDGVVDVARGEQCDGTPCCSPTCLFESAGTACEDGIVCTASDTCDGSGTCESGGPATGCVAAWDKASLLIKENKPGKEKLKVKIKGGPALVQADFGDPLNPGGTSYSVCIFDDADNLAGHLGVERAGDVCAGKPCWADKKGTGWQYKDKLASSDGVGQIKLGGGDAGKTQIQVKAGNNSNKGQLAVPTGIASALVGSANAKVQVLTTDAQCYEVVVDEIKKQEAGFFKATK